MLENSIFGKRLGVIFDYTAATCLDADRSTHFRKRIRVSFGKHEIRTIKQVILDKGVVALFCGANCSRITGYRLG
ncbi:MAG: hypothetical protein ACT6RN_05480 [Agrobacterium sp.]|uniref:hypothetical protein n=1 Tax=Agrobacterium sp. TaxID=361 RepID=UPI0040349030